MDKAETGVLIDEMLSRYESRQDAKKAAEKEAEEKLGQLKTAVRKEVEEEVKKDTETWMKERGISVPATMKVARPGSGGEKGDNDTFVHWMRTGDDVAARKSLAEVDLSDDIRAAKAQNVTTGTAGGYTVPEDVQSGIVSLRDVASFPRMAGVLNIKTDRMIVDIPTESGGVAVARRAEAASAATDDFALAQNQATLQSWAVTTRFTNELLNDSPAEVESWYRTLTARAIANMESQYAATGSGSNQHEGILVGGDSDTLTGTTANGYIDSDGNIGLNTPWAIYYSLGEQYRADAFWLMKGSTEQALVTLKTTQANPAFVFGMPGMSMEWRDNRLHLLGHPVFSQENMGGIVTGNTPFIFFGSKSYYALIDHTSGLQALRNPYQYGNAGIVAIHTFYRQTGKVLYKAAFSGFRATFS